MNQHIKYGVVQLALVAAVMMLPVHAAEHEGEATQAQSREQAGTQTQEQAYGWQLMTQQERLEYRDKMRTLKTAQEREQFRQTHHAQMMVRAKEQGVTLPEEPRNSGQGMGSGGGMGGGGMGRR